MTKRISAKHKIDRRLKINLWGRPKSPFNKRDYGPGQHGQGRKGKPSNYGIQLRSFSLSGLFLEPFLAHVWPIFRLFWFSFRSWAHFGGALGAKLFHHKNGLDHQRRPNRHFP